jgi:general secretion pathway protein F
MAVYQFRGIAVSSGKEIRGVRDADNAKGLRTALRREGIVLTSATEAREATEKKARDIQLFAFLNRVTIGDVAILTRQLAVLIRAGIPLADAIGALTDQVEKEQFKNVLARVRQQINEGTAFANALAEHPTVFPPLYVNMVAAGEASGMLETVLDRLATFMDAQAKLRGKVSAAMAYPILMLIIGSILITVLMIGVVPKVTAIFATLERALPWYTQVLIFVSTAVASPISHGLLVGAIVGTAVYGMTTASQQRNEPVLLDKDKASFEKANAAATEQKAAPKKAGGGSMAIFVVGGFVALLEIFFRESAFRFVIAILPGFLLGLTIGAGLAWLKSPRGKVAFDGLLLNAPIFGPLFQMIAVARFANTLATLLASGVQLLRAMDIVKSVIGNAALEKVVEEATGSIREGESIAEPLRRSKRFPPIVTHMIAVGEKSGQLEQMLEAVTTSYESAIETRITALTSLLEPLMIVIMGGAVGFIAFAILMPLIQMNDFNQ